MQISLALVGAFGAFGALVACGDAAPPVRAVDARGAESAPTPAPSAARAATADNDCTSADTIFEPRRRHDVPATWHIVGKLQIHIHADAGQTPDFVSYDVRDASGKIVLTRPFKGIAKEPGDSGDTAFRRFVGRGICSVGAVAGVGPAGQNDKALDEQLKNTGDATMDLELLAPPREDEASDLEKICRPPSVSPDGDDPKMRVAHEFIDAKETLFFLTSRKWRTWVGKINDAPNAEAMGHVADAFAEATRGAGKPSCFFPESAKKLAAQSLTR